MRKSGFTLLEMIFVVVVSAILAMGSFKAMEMLYLRSAKAKAVTDLTLRSQIVLDQIGVYLYDRVPNSVIGYNPPDNDCQAITDINSTHPVLEWLATMNDELIRKEYDGFIDMGNSNRDTHILKTVYMDKNFDDSGVNLIFAGAFDEGTEDSVKACSGAFGWHGNDSNLSYGIDVIDTDEINLTDDDDHQPDYIYEKYYLTHTAYAVARGVDLNETDLKDNCNGSYSPPQNDYNFSTTLFLFSDYKPYAGETFCGDNSGTRKGVVSILATDVSSFEAIYQNEAIRLNLEFNRTIRGSKSPVHIYKQKVVF